MRHTLRLTLALALTTGLARAQEAAAAAPAPGVHTKTMMDTFHEGGWVMYPILICSMALIWLVVDGYMRTAKKKVYPAEHVQALRELFQQGNYRAAYQYAKDGASPFTDVVRVGLSMAPEGKEMTEEAIFAEIARVNGDFQGRISYLSVIGVCTPMIGLTGTVTGMMTAFETLGSSGVGDPSKLAGAIGEVLIATAAGLFIAIPAFIFYYLIRNRVQDGVHDITELVNGLFRAYPYDKVAGKEIGDERPYAADPVWTEPTAAEAPQA